MNSKFALFSILAGFVLLFGCASQEKAQAQSGTAPAEEKAPAIQPPAPQEVAPQPAPQPAPPQETPAPEIKLCTDTDGDDIKVKGTVTFGGKPYVDSCSSPKNVREYICQNDVSVATVKECAIGFDCKSGACVERGQTCIDSEGEKNTQKPGYVIVNDGSDNIDSSTQYTDRCVQDDKAVEEFYCDGNQLKSETAACIGGCDRVTGACFASAG